MNNRAALFAHSIQCLSSTVMVMMSPMNPYIDASVAVMSTDRRSYFEKNVFLAVVYPPLGVRSVAPAVLFSFGINNLRE